MGIKNIIIVAIFILAYHVIPIAAIERSHIQYTHFFPAWSHLLSEYLGAPCRKPWHDYSNRTFEDQRVSYTVLDCLLRQFDEFRKAELAASAVVLGLTPTILQMLSPSSADTALLANRRPVLAILLSASTAAVSPTRGGQVVEGVEKLVKPLSHQMSARFPFTLLKSKGEASWTPAVVSIVEYLIAGAAAGNSAYRTYQLCLWSVCVFAPQHDFLPAVWHCSALAIHFLRWFAMLALFKSPFYTAYRKPWEAWIHSEVRPAAWGDKILLKKRAGEPGYLFHLLDSLLYIAIPVQILYGTMVLSSLVFLSVFDAVVIVTWYACSTVVCRGILMYELAGMREANQPRRRPYC